jgi:hypothetical protein
MVLIPKDRVLHGFTICLTVDLCRFSLSPSLGAGFSGYHLTLERGLQLAFEKITVHQILRPANK